MKWLALMILPLILDALPAGEAKHQGGWRELFNGRDLSGWRTHATNHWVVDKDGVLAWKAAAVDLWTEEQFENFVLELEFKVTPGANSGIFIRTGDIADNVQTGIEVQIYDSFGKKPEVWHCGAIYDAAAPTVMAEKKPGEWNRMSITAHGPRITVALNGQTVNDINLNDWTEAGKNPDGSANKFRQPLKDFPRKGFLGIQDHHKQVWFRNLRIRRLEEERR